MKKLKFFRFFIIAAIIGTTVSFLSSCDKEEGPDVNFGEVTGLVTDESGNPVSDVTVSLSDFDGTGTSGADGKYSIKNVPIDKYSVTFTKKGYETITTTIAATKFNSDKIATVNISMVNASAKITGIITDVKNGDAPLEGVVVKYNETQSVTSGADGRYTIEDLTVNSYTLTFTKENYVSVTKVVSPTDFVVGVATVDVQMGNAELLRGLTIDNLRNAEKWYYNEYRGGRNADAYPHWDWACNYMSTLDFRGDWQEQNEGTTLRIRNSEADRGNPADLEMFDSYVFGSKKITNDNKILSLRLRTHNADEASPAHFGVQVIDLSASEPVAVKIGENKTYGSENYADFDFDLGAYVGKEVVIAVGIYRQATGDYWKQLVLRAIRFADKKVENWDWLPGTEVVSGWKLTQETVRSTMAHTLSSFTGISPVSGNRDSYVDAYRAWRDVKHIASEWSFVPLKKDPEVFPSEGYLIKTRNTSEVDTNVPEAYLYAKFNISSSNDELTMKVRNFSVEYTYFKLTAIKNDGTVIHLAPKSNTAQEAMAAENGCWKFKHEDGGAGNPEGYASFVYDLSQFNGNEVTLVIGVYNGVANSGENKLAFYSVDLK